MTDQEKIQKLKHAFEETIWMAIRYADGRRTYAPDTVRQAINQFKIVFPDWKPRPDGVIKPPKKEDVKSMNLASYHLHDIF